MERRTSFYPLSDMSEVAAAGITFLFIILMKLVSQCKLLVYPLLVSACALPFVSCGGGGGGGGESGDAGLAPPTFIPGNTGGNTNQGGTANVAAPTCVVSISNFKGADGTDYSVTLTCEGDGKGSPTGDIVACRFTAYDDDHTSYEMTKAKGTWENNSENTGDCIRNLKFKCEFDEGGSETFRLQIDVREMRVQSRIDENNGNLRILNCVLTNAEASVKITGQYNKEAIIGLSSTEAELRYE